MCDGAFKTMWQLSLGTRHEAQLHAPTLRLPCSGGASCQLRGALHARQIRLQGVAVDARPPLLQPSSCDF